MKLTGIVKKYSGNGRKLGFPTANIELVEPAHDGLYLGMTLLNGDLLPSIVYIGAPEVYKAELRRLESHILSFPDRDLYGETIEVEILHKLRDNVAFTSEAALIVQMKKDVRAARAFFKTYVHRHNNPHDKDHIQP